LSQGVRLPVGAFWHPGVFLLRSGIMLWVDRDALGMATPSGERKDLMLKRGRIEHLSMGIAMPICEAQCGPMQAIGSELFVLVLSPAWAMTIRW
jgi:hypothetical protein